MANRTDRTDEEIRDLIRLEVQTALKPALDAVASMSVIVSDLNDAHNKALRRPTPASAAAPPTDHRADLDMIQQAEDRGAGRIMQAMELASKLFAENQKAMMNGWKLAQDMRAEILDELADDADDAGPAEPSADDVKNVVAIGEALREQFKGDR